MRRRRTMSLFTWTSQVRFVHFRYTLLRVLACGAVITCLTEHTAHVPSCNLAGAEFEVLEHMVHDSSLLLVDAIEVKWNDVFRPEFLEWPAMYSQVIGSGSAGRSMVQTCCIVNTTLCRMQC